MAAIGMILAVALAAVIAVVIVRTRRFVPMPQAEVKTEIAYLDKTKIVADMQDMIRCKTVSHADESLTDFAEFERFQALLA